MWRPPRFLWIGIPSLAASLGCGPPTAAPSSTETAASKSAPTATSDAPVPAASGADIKARCYEGIAALFGSLREPMKVDVYITRKDPKLDVLASRIDEIMSKMQASSGGRLDYRLLDATPDEIRDQARAAGVQEMIVGDGGPDMASARGYSGVVFRYGAEQNVLPVLGDDVLSGYEFWIANKVRELRAIVHERPTRIGVVTGKDETSITEANLLSTGSAGASPNLRGILEEALPFYRFVDVDLGQEIDPDLDGLVLTQPGEPLTEPELRRIDAFLVQGGALSVFGSSVSIARSDPSMEAHLDDQGLSRLLAPYGIEMQKSAVLDPAHALRLPVMTESGGAASITAPAVLILANLDAELDSKWVIDSGFPGFFGLNELAFPFPSPLVVHADRQPAATLRVVARSSTTAFSDAAPTQDMSLASQHPAPNDTRPFALAVMVEGKLESAFGAGQSPATRMLVVASSQFLANPFARAGNPPPMPPQMQMMGSLGGDRELQLVAGPYAQAHLTKTILAFKNTLDWMSNDEDLIPCSALLVKPSTEEGSGKCTKEELLKLMDAGLSVDDAVDVCKKRR